MGKLKHGHTRRSLPQKRTRLYVAWSNMRARCRNPNDRCYAMYGGRGIRVCERWDDSFAAFEADMGPHPGAGYSLERLNNDGHYAPGNVRWATAKEQGRNKRNNVYLTFRGERLHVSEWASRTGLRVHNITNRLSLGWTVERALTEPRRNFPQHIKREH